MTKVIATVISCLITINLYAQKVEYLNDSLFVNQVYVTSSFTKTQLDSLLGVKGKEKNKRDKYTKDTNGKRIKVRVLTYPNGLIFKKFEHQPERLSLSIKLYHSLNNTRDHFKGVFDGQLWIGNNLLNGKKTIAELETLTNCAIEIHRIEMGHLSSIIGGDLIYQNNLIRLSFNTQSEELEAIHIHHNLRRDYRY